MVESGNVTPNWEFYNTVEPEYERYYFDIDSRGFVLIHREHSTTASEIFIAEVFARQGRQVKLLSERSELTIKLNRRDKVRSQSTAPNPLFCSSYSVSSFQN